MDKFIDELPSYVDIIKSIKETIITNIVLIGQIPCSTFKEKRRVNMFMERMSDASVDECRTDSYNNPIGIIKGTSETKPPIFVVAHLDSFTEKNVDHNYMVKENTITGPGILDNAIGVGVLISLPEIIKKSNLSFESDIVLAGVIQSIGKGNLRGIRHLLKIWDSPIRGAICLEGCELGRLNYYSDGMIRGEIECSISKFQNRTNNFHPNAILTLNEVINQILKIHLPQRPRSRIIFGKISGGFKHGKTAYDARLGFEIQSDSDKMVKNIYTDIKDIVIGISHEYDVELKLKTISNANASKLSYNHPLVKNAWAIMDQLNIKPVSEPSESELSIFLSHKIPAITVGITRGSNYHLDNARMEIEPMFKGIAQIIGLLMAIDEGICDESQLA